MKKYDLSILIPALREEFLKDTVEDILRNKRGNTEVIVGLDGAWSEPGVPDHPDVRIVYVSKNQGQRGMTNTLCRLSTAKYVAKCDAHVAFDEGFDIKLMEHMQDNYTMVPVMRNLHVFNWRCTGCGDETYQGPEPEGCKSCDVNTPDHFEKIIKWHAKPSPQSTAYRFTPDRLQFKYFGALKRQQSGPIAETMSLQGSFFMLTRAKYWELNICDESWGGWGQQGTEVALKTWLSGGRVVCNMTTWYAHMFRTQSGFAFPWGNPARQQEQARRACMDTFFKNNWDKQVRPLSWVIERFWNALQKEGYQPEKGDRPWTREDLAEVKKTEGRFIQSPTEKGVIYYTDNQLPVKLAKRIQNQVKKCGLPIVSASLKPMDNMGRNVRIKGERGTLSYFRQIVAALEASTAEYVFFCEHDVLYHPSHFDFTPLTKDKFYYNTNVWRVRQRDGFAVTWEANQVAELCCAREFALTWYREKLKQVEAGSFDRSYEPGGRDPLQYGRWRSAYPNIDIRHDGNLTKSKWSPNDFRDKSTCVNWQESVASELPGWEGKLQWL
jgi:Glycosyltransferases involved in cell wall biogenesis